MKKIIALALTLIMSLVLVACSNGSEGTTLDGTWSISTIGDMSLEDYAASYGVTADQVQTTYVFDGDTVSVTNALTGTFEAEAQETENGVDVVVNGVTSSLTFDGDTLVFESQDAEGNTIETILVKE